MPHFKFRFKAYGFVRDFVLESRSFHWSTLGTYPYAEAVRSDIFPGSLLLEGSMGQLLVVPCTGTNTYGTLFLLDSVWKCTLLFQLYRGDILWWRGLLGLIKSEG